MAQWGFAPPSLLTIILTSCCYILIFGSSATSLINNSFNCISADFSNGHDWPLEPNGHNWPLEHNGHEPNGHNWSLLIPMDMNPMDIIDLLNPMEMIDLLNPMEMIDLWNPMDTIDVQKVSDWANWPLLKVRRTETKNNNLNPDWSVLYMSLNELCESDFNTRLQVIGFTIHWLTIQFIDY